MEEHERWLLKYCRQKDDLKDGNPKMFYTETGMSISKQINSVLHNKHIKSDIIETLFPNLSDIDKFKVMVICSLIEDASRNSAVLDLLVNGVKGKI